MCGYILCAKDLKAYEKNAYPYYLTLKELDEVKAERFPNANRELERFYPEYPAHIHIDILKEYTGNGVCSKLMQALFEVLKEGWQSQQSCLWKQTASGKTPGQGQHTGRVVSLLGW